MNQNALPDSASVFIQSHSIALRMWHWLNFLVISASILTVILNSTLLSPRDNVLMVQEQLQRKGITATDDQAFAVSHEYEEKMWDVHKYLGFCLAALFLARVVIEFFQPEEEKLKNRIKKALTSPKENPEKLSEYRHYLLVRRIYLAFFVVLFAVVLSGLTIAFGRSMGIPRDIVHSIKETHAVLQYIIYAFIIIHLAGVIKAETQAAKGIVSGMIHGNKN